MLNIVFTRNDFLFLLFAVFSGLLFLKNGQSIFSIKDFSHWRFTLMDVDS